MRDLMPFIIFAIGIFLLCYSTLSNDDRIKDIEKDITVLKTQMHILIIETKKNP